MGNSFWNSTIANINFCHLLCCCCSLQDLALRLMAYVLSELLPVFSNAECGSLNFRQNTVV